LLGASGDRLAEYGWPFYFVVLPWFLALLSHLRAVWVLPLHLITCWLAWFAFRSQSPSFLLPGLAVLALNVFGYIFVKRETHS
jgi:hypothetical protein